MPTKIKIVIPGQTLEDFEDDVASIASTNTHLDLYPDGLYDQSTQTDIFYSNADNGQTLEAEIISPPPPNSPDVEPIKPSLSRNAPTKIVRHRVERPRTAPPVRQVLSPTRVGAVGSLDRRVVKQYQHTLANGERIGTPLVLARHNSRPASATVSSSRSAAKDAGTGGKNGHHLAFSTGYDVDLEYKDIMVKALHSYSHHRHREAATTDTTAAVAGDVSKSTKQSKNAKPHPSVSGTTNRDVLNPIQDTVPEKRLSHSNNYKSHHSCVSESFDEESLFDHVFDDEDEENKRVLKLSQCRLKYIEETEEPREPMKMKRRRTMSARTLSSSSSTSSSSLRNKVKLHPPPPSDGILADSIGRVYTTVTKASKGNQRPWTALPCKFSDYPIAAVKQNGAEEKRSFENQISPTKAFTESSQTQGEDSSHHQSSSNSPNSNLLAQHRLHVQTLQLSGRLTMSGGKATPRSVAYQRRNQTTHSWYDTGSMMSQSLPNTSFLHRQFVGGASSLGSTPRSSRDATSEKSSPAGKSSNMPRPSSSYSYDGGFFVGAHAGQAEYFVIHPDWVSEAMTIKKLSVNNKSPPPVVSKPVAKKNWQGRRCMSAPPAKLRNPITWDQNASESLNIPVRKK